MPEPLSLTHKRWILRPSAEAATGHTLMPLLLKERGLEEMNLFTDPSAYPHMSRAVQRIRSAMEHGERICVFGDYDCDGIVAATQLVRFFRRHAIEPYIRLPHRVRDGYGLSRFIVTELKRENIRLLITVDTGIVAVPEVAEAQASGIDVIVTDHHHPPEELPAAYAVLHPATAPGFPLPYPSGAGVAHTLVQALEGGHWADEDTDIALAAIGTIADMVELRGANRTLVREGLQKFSELSEGPLALLAEHAHSGTAPLTSTDVGFRIAPRLNAAGRMDDPMIALRALLEGGESLSILERLNAERQDDTRLLYQRALTTLGLTEGNSCPETTVLLAVAGEQYPPGIIGLIAGRLTEQYGRPSIVVSVTGDTCTASLRSPAGYHITEGLTRCQHLLDRFGGHAQAAGATLALKNLRLLAKALHDDIRTHAKPEDLLPTVAIDALLEPADINLSFCEALSILEPFGMGNPEPLFLLEGVTLEKARRVGSDGAHLQGRVAGTKCVAFHRGPLLPQISGPIDIVGRLGIDVWNDRKEPQIYIEDMRITVKKDVNASKKALNSKN